MGKPKRKRERVLIESQDLAGTITVRSSETAEALSWMLRPDPARRPGRIVATIYAGETLMDAFRAGAKAARSERSRSAGQERAAKARPRVERDHADLRDKHAALVKRNPQIREEAAAGLLGVDRKTLRAALGKSR